MLLKIRTKFAKSFFSQQRPILVAAHESCSIFRCKYCMMIMALEKAMIITQMRSLYLTYS